jgi:APA family basic amino acid/polyamine antiporter
LGRVHQRFKTPYISIIIFSAVALVILIPGFFAPRAFLELGALYAFGSLLSFALAHASIMSLRIKNPDLPRPFRLRWNIRFRQGELPVTAILGLLGTAAVWLVVIFTQPYSRWVGFGWMAVGLIIYVIFRWRRKIHSDKLEAAKMGYTESQR